MLPSSTDEDGLMNIGLATCKYITVCLSLCLYLIGNGISFFPEQFDKKMLHVKMGLVNKLIIDTWIKI